MFHSRQHFLEARRQVATEAWPKKKQALPKDWGAVPTPLGIAAGAAALSLRGSPPRT
jgi:hypothetical protein